MDLSATATSGSLNVEQESREICPARTGIAGDVVGSFLSDFLVCLALDVIVIQKNAFRPLSWFSRKPLSASSSKFHAHTVRWHLSSLYSDALWRLIGSREHATGTGDKTVIATNSSEGGIELIARGTRMDGM